MNLEMPLADLLKHEHVVIGPSWLTFDQTIGGLVDCLATTGALDPGACDEARHALLAREAQASTAIAEIGVGVPHARLPRLTAAVAALAVSSDGLYDTVPGVPIRIVALVLSPEAATDAHLQLLAGVAMSLRSTSLRTALLRATDAADAISALRAPS